METAQLNKCKNCGGELEATNSSVFNCPYCGSVYKANLPDQLTSVVQDHINEGTEYQNENITDGEDLKNNQVIDFETQPATVDPGYRALPPIGPTSRKLQLYGKAVLVFLFLWVGLYFFRLNMPDGKTNLSEHHNLIFSPIGGDYWWIRGVLFLGLFPYLCSISIYSIKYKNK